MPLTDDEAIATALLHGAEFTTIRPDVTDDLTYLRGSGHGAIHEKNKRDTGLNGFKSYVAIARAYCEHYNLEG